MVERKLPKLDAASSILVSRSVREDVILRKPVIMIKASQLFTNYPVRLINTMLNRCTYISLFLLLFILLSGAGCSKAVKKESDIDTVKNHYVAGIQKLNKNDTKSAETDFKRAIELDKTSPMGYTGMALLKLNQSDYKGALKQ